MNTNELKYYSFMISLNKCTGRCNVLSSKICIPKEKNRRYVHVKAFNLITNKDEAKVMTEHISCDWKSNLNSTTCNSKQKGNHKTFQCECKTYHKCEKVYSLKPSRCVCENIIADTSVTEYDEM